MVEYQPVLRILDISGVLVHIPELSWPLITSFSNSFIIY